MGTRNSGLTAELLPVTANPPAALVPKQVSSERFSPNSTPRSSGERDSLAFVLVTQRVEPDFEKVLVVRVPMLRDAGAGAGRDHDGDHQVFEQTQGPERHDRPAERAAGEVADDVDVELFERRSGGNVRFR